MYDELPDLDDDWSPPENSTISNTSAVNKIKPIEEAITILSKSMSPCEKILGSPISKSCGAEGKL